MKSASTHHDNLFDECLVAAEPRSLHRSHVGSQPSHEKEFGPFAHLVSALFVKRMPTSKINIPSTLTTHYRCIISCPITHMNTDEPKCSVVVGEVFTKFIEISANCFAANLVSFELEDGPVKGNEYT